MKKILVTSRDVGAAFQLVEIVRYIRSESDMTVTFFASNPAAQILAAQGETLTLFEPALPYQRTISEEDLRTLRAGAHRIVQTERPDIVLCGLSNYAYGIDDAVTQASRMANWPCPSALLLDDKGPLQNFDGDQPDYILAVSEDIARWSEANSHAQVYRIGSPKHDALSRLPVNKIRNNERARRQLVDGDRLLVFVAQSSDIPGHDENLSDFVQTMSEIAGDLPRFTLIVRGHPGFPETGRAYVAQAKQAGLNVIFDSGGGIVPLLCAADIVMACTSTAIQDYTWLARGGDQLRARLVHLLIGDEFRSWLQETFGDWRPPAVRQGLAWAITSRKELRDLLLTDLGSDALAKNLQPAAKPEVNDPRTTSLAALRAILSVSTTRPSRLGKRI